MINKLIASTDISAFLAAEDSAAAREALGVDALVDVLHRSTYYPEEYGAVGDGVTDDSAAFVTMIAAMPTTGGEISLRNKYRFTNVHLNKSAKIQGINSGWQDNSGRHAAVTSIISTSTTEDCLIIDASGVTICDLEFYNGSTATSGCAIKFNQGYGVRLSRCAFSGWFDQVHFVNGMLWHTSDCVFNDFYHVGLIQENVSLPDGGDASIVGSIFASTRASEACILIHSGGGLKITNSKFNAHVYNPQSPNWGIRLAVADGVQTSILLINSCAIEGMVLGGVLLGRKDGGTTGTYSYAAVRNCQMGYMPVAVKVQPGAADACVSDNQFILCPRGVHLDDDSLRCSVATNTHTQCNLAAVEIGVRSLQHTISPQVIQNNQGAGYPCYPVFNNAFGESNPPLIEWRYQRKLAWGAAIALHRLAEVGLPSYTSGTIRVVFEGQVVGVGAFAFQMERSYTRHGGAPTLATIGTDVAVGTGSVTHTSASVTAGADRLTLDINALIAAAGWATVHIEIKGTPFYLLFSY